MISVLLRWAPSLNDRSKLKGQCTDVKSGCGPSVGPSLNPHSLSLKQKSRATVPLRTIFFKKSPQMPPNPLQGGLVYRNVTKISF